MALFPWEKGAYDLPSIGTAELGSPVTSKYLWLTSCTRVKRSAVGSGTMPFASLYVKHPVFRASLFCTVSQFSCRSKGVTGSFFCHEPTECYDCMGEARREESSGKALLLVLVVCMHDAM